jgi:hypothetical protein
MSSQNKPNNILYDDSDNDSLVNISFTSMDIINLNIGGNIFTISQQNIEKYPSLIFNQDLHNSDALRDSRGRLFYDRDPETFKLIVKLINGYNISTKQIVDLELFKDDLLYYNFDSDEILDKINNNNNEIITINFIDGDIKLLRKLIN